MKLTVSGPWFRDAHGRRVLLRGVNLGGSSKLPAGVHPLGSATHPTEPGAVTFVGRPFPLADADEHYARLRHWGFNCLRFVVTWEAVEHAGPGRYDEAYLAYLRAVIAKAGEHGLHVFVDPHQDVWSRASGGDGAPAWTLAKVGFDLAQLDASDAAITLEGRHPDYARMIWPSNAQRLASATMFTLFFAGDRFAPRVAIEGEPAQAYLQRHFIHAMRAVAERVGDLDCVLGYDCMNEPSAGYIGMASLRAPLPAYVAGPVLTGFDAMVAPAGFAREVPHQHGMFAPAEGTLTLNPNAACAWTGGLAADIWRAHGVWDTDARGQPALVRDDYFAGVRFYEECVHPFVQRYAAALRAVDPDAIFFIEGEPASPEPLRWEGPAPVVNASHWYDGLTLMTRTFHPELTVEWGTNQPVSGAAEVRASMARQIAAICAVSREQLGGAPTLIGEFGLPFDLDGGAAYQTGDFSPHVTALTGYYDALDANLAHATQWNYTADNTHAWGDGWNHEDLSVYSRDDQRAAWRGTDPSVVPAAVPVKPASVRAPGDLDAPGALSGLDDGARALRGFCRPRMLAAAGTPTRQRFDITTGDFELALEVDPLVDAPTVLYVPRAHYPAGVALEVTSGAAAYDPATQHVQWRGAAAGAQQLAVRRAG